MREGTRNRRDICVGSLRERFTSNICMIKKKKTVWQDQKDFTLEFPVNLENDRVYRQGKKSDILDDSLLTLTNNMSK